MLKRKKHKKSECWLFCVECDLDIRRRFLGIQRLKGLSGRERKYMPQPWAHCALLGPPKASG